MIRKNIKKGDVLEVKTKLSNRVIGIFEGCIKENRAIYYVLSNATQYKKYKRSVRSYNYDTYKIRRKDVKEIKKINNSKFKHCPKCKYGRLIYNKRIKKYICVLCGYEVER